MDKHENPVVQRQLDWINRMKSKEFTEWLLEGKPKPYLIIAMTVAKHEKSVNEKIWFDYVDGIVGGFIRELWPNVKVPYKERFILGEAGFYLIADFISSTKYQNETIHLHQFRTDYIAIAEGIQTKVNAKSLIKFRELIGKTVIGRKGVWELRRELITRVQTEYIEDIPAKRDKVSPTLTVPEAGIVLYFLMYCGSGKFEKTRNKKTLESHLETLGLKRNEQEEFSGTQVYNKGIVHLITDADRGDGIKIRETESKGKFTKMQFLKAIAFLKKHDEKAYQTANSEFEYKCGEDANGGDGESYFKN